eukprot:jgi/Chlat1/2090/Chrsp17S02832
MRPLEEAEAKAVFEKLHKYLGNNVRRLVERKDEPHCLRLHKQRVYYVKESLMRRATNVARDHLVALGTCIGKFTKSGKFRLTVWVKPSAEMSFLYGNHVLKSGLGRITENTPAYQGVVVYSMSDIPLGFGIAAKSTQDCRKLDPNGIVALHQADVGEYLRMEDDL